MRRLARFAVAVVLVAGAIVVGCARAAARSEGAIASAPASSLGATNASAASSALTAAATDAGIDALVADASIEREAGPYGFDFAPGRRVFVVAARDASKPQRLIGMLHGVCNPPEYACGLWQESATDLGFLVCPAGNASCGPAMYDAPTWTEPDTKIDEDLERSIDATLDAFPNAIDRSDAVLCGFSKGAYTAMKIALAHPGRWPYLVFNEANVQPSVDQLQKAKVRAVAFIAGEIGGQIGKEKSTVAKLQKAGFPAKFWPMPKAGHYYSEDIATIMREAIEFVTSVPASE